MFKAEKSFRQEKVKQTHYIFKILIIQLTKLLFARRVADLDKETELLMESLFQEGLKSGHIPLHGNPPNTSDCLLSCLMGEAHRSSSRTCQNVYKKCSNKLQLKVQCADPQAQDQGPNMLQITYQDLICQRLGLSFDFCSSNSCLYYNLKWVL